MTPTPRSSTCRGGTEPRFLLARPRRSRLGVRSSPALVFLHTFPPRTHAPSHTPHARRARSKRTRAYNSQPSSNATATHGEDGSANKRRAHHTASSSRITQHPPLPQDTNQHPTLTTHIPVTTTMPQPAASSPVSGISAALVQTPSTCARRPPPHRPKTWRPSHHAPYPSYRYSMSF